MKRVEAVVRRISGEWSAFVELSDCVGAKAAGQAKVGNTIRRFKCRTATGAREIRCEPLRARRTGEQFSEAVHF
jgi:hypothetical protein